MKSEGGNNSLGSIASISKTRKMGGKNKQWQEQVKRQRKNEYLASRARWQKGNQVENEG